MNTQTKTIVFFSRYLPSMGGIENFTQSLSHELRRQGHNVIIVTTDGKPGIAKENGVIVLRLRSIELLGGRYPVPLSINVRKKIKSIIGVSTCINVVINSRFYPLSLIGASFASSMGVKPILIDHSSSYIKAKSKMVSKTFEIADKLMTNVLNRYPIDYYGVSKMSSRWLTSFGIQSKGEISNAIDAESFIKQSSGHVFINNESLLSITYAGRLIEEKGVLTVANLAQRFPGVVEVYIAGSGPLEAQIKLESKKVDNLHFLGRLSHPDLASLLIQSDVFCFPSTYGEGLPTCLLEAAACKCALITTVNGGTEEIIPSSSYGFILKSEESEELNTLVGQFIQNPNLYKSCAIEVYKHVLSSFSWNQTAHSLLQAFMETN